jgi:hypothetical protein
MDYVMNEKNDKSAIERAREFGIDISLLEENLKRTPTERLLSLQETMKFFEEVRSARERELKRSGSVPVD